MKKIAPKIKRKKMDVGGTVTPDLSKLTPDQLATYYKLPDDTAKTNYLSSVMNAGGSISTGTKTAIGTGAIATGKLINTVGDNNSKDGQGTEFSRVSSGVLSDAATGFEVGGPWGAVAGAGIGLATSLVGETQRNKVAQQKKVDAAQAAVSGLQDHLASGGQVKGPGGPTDDLVETTLPAGSFVVPAVNAKKAISIRKDYLGEKRSGMKKGGNVPVALSNGEHVFTPEEVKYLATQGVKLDALAPEASEAYAKRNGGKVYLKPKPGAKQVVNAQIPQLKVQGGLVQKLAAGTGPEGVQPDPEKTDLLELSDPNVQSYLKGLMHLEADPKNIIGGKNPDSTATGAFQFTKSTRDLIFKKYGYDAYSKDLQEQQKAAVALIKEKGALDAVKSGDFKAADNALKDTWPSLPGGSQPNKNLDSLESIRNQTRLANTDDTRTPSKDAFSKNKSSQTYWDKYGLDPKNFDKNYVNWVNSIYNKNPDVTPKTLGDTLNNDSNWQKNADGTYTQKGDSSTKQQEYLTTINPKPVNSTTAPGLYPRIADPAKPTALATPSKQVPINPGQNVFDKLGGWGGMAALAQTGFGIANLLSIGKRPIDAIDPTLINRRDEAIADNRLNPAVKAAAQNAIELQKRSTTATAQSASGGDVGAGIAGAMEAQRNASNATIGLAGQEEQELAQKNARADSLTGVVAGAKRQLFQDKLSAFEQNQQAGGALLRAGISNFIGNLDYKAQLEQMRQRDKLYNNPQNTVPVVQS